MEQNKRKNIALVFDVDGTLWDGTKSVAESWSVILKKYLNDEEAAYSKEFVTSLMGRPMDYIGEQITPKSFNSTKKHEFIEECFSFENEYLAKYPGELFPHEEETLKKLKELGYTLFIVSNCQLGYIDSFKKGTGLGNYFSGNMCYGDTNAPKHVTINKLLNKYGYKKAIYIGDTLGDETETHKLNLPFIFANWGFGESKDPDYIAKSYPDIIDGAELLSKKFFNL